jgi:hypothetical protein
MRVQQQQLQQQQAQAVLRRLLKSPAAPGQSKM